MLRSSIKFLNVDASNALKAGVKEQLSSLQKRFAKMKKNGSLDFKVIGLDRFADGKLKLVESEVLLKLPGKAVKAFKKSGRDIQAVCKQAIDAADKVMGRESQKRTTQKRKVGTRKSVRASKRAQ